MPPGTPGTVAGRLTVQGKHGQARVILTAALSTPEDTEKTGDAR
ncbi:hypothetical protein [Carbonactinospora thermoautotrophica]|nr:hypothetical protein [Carbonactinospora thermoautotrophica]